MMKKVFSVIATSVMVLSVSMNSMACETGNNVLKSGKVVGIEYNSDINNPDGFDKLEFEIDNQIYTWYDYAEDMEIDDNVLIVINDNGTENIEDDIIMMWRYWNPIDHK